VQVSDPIETATSGKLEVSSDKTRLAATALLACMAVLASCAIRQRAATPSTTELEKMYERAVRESAVRRPDWNVPLWSFGDAQILSVSTFTEDSTLDTASQYVWVAPTAQMRQMCKGKSDSVLSLQQILGLPPQKNPQPGNQWKVITFDVSREAVFRPCPGGLETASNNNPRCSAGNSLDPHLDRETAYFLLNQYWVAHHAAIVGDGKTDLGFPWTGMGWTFNWDPNSKAHVGVSEFVVRKGAITSNVYAVAPAVFCSAEPPVTGLPGNSNERDR
jgi:hypothetical protein